MNLDSSSPIDSPDSESAKSSSKSTILFVLALAFAMFGVGAAGARVYRDYAPVVRDFEFEKTGHFDFHNGGYLPALAFREGVNPYAAEVCELYPVTRPSATYSPSIFMIHYPFSLLPVKAADVVYFLFNAALIGLLGYWSITMSQSKFAWTPWLLIFGMLAFSRPGHMSLYTGYFTAQLVVGTVLALHFAKTKPWLAGIGMVIASGKPTYIIPLIMLLLARKNFKAAIIGVIMCAAVAGAGIGWLASSSDFSTVVEEIKSGQDAFDADENEIPVNTWTRLDSVGVIAKIIDWKPDNKTYLAFMVVLLIIPCWAIWNAAEYESNSGMTGLTGILASVAILVTIYHHSYDCLLVAIPWVGLTFFGKLVCPELKSIERWALSVLLGITAINYASTLKVRSLLSLENQSAIWNVITAVNGVCLFAALIILIVASFRLGRTNQSHFEPKS